VTKIAILGGGSWGTGLAVVLSRSHTPHEISMWVRDSTVADCINRTRENPAYLPGVQIPANVRASTIPSEALRDTAIFVCAVPSTYLRGVLTELLPHFSTHSIFVSATKGLEPATHLRMSEVIEQVLNTRFVPQIAVLSGPSFALEAARGEPTAVVIASASTPEKFVPTLRRYSPATAESIQAEFAGPSFRLYTNDDVLGVELAGAMKNVIAIAAGVCQGLGIGHNSLAALITRGLAEMTRLAVALGARQETLSGLAGLGDLVLTCTGNLSRNRGVGIQLGQGHLLPEILANMNMVAEGVSTAAALLSLAAVNQIDLPITKEVNAILHHGKSPRDAIRSIMDRPQKREYSE
jgi:glycerol-3-phosphate dehydrogenase (NAD(P)+)